MLASPQPSDWYMGVKQRPKEWSGDLLANHPNSEAILLACECTDEGMDRTTFSVRKIPWPNHNGPTLSPTPMPSMPKMGAASTSNSASTAPSKLYNPIHQPAIRQHLHLACNPPPRRGIERMEASCWKKGWKEEWAGFLWGFFSLRGPTPGITGAKQFTFPLPAAQIHNSDCQESKET